MRRIFGSILVMAGMFGIATSLISYINQPRPPMQTPRAISAEVHNSPVSVAPSTKTVASYSVPQLDPKYITVPSIGIAKARIMKLGLLGNGDMATPNNVYDTGWYDDSSRPGQTGAMFIFGHVSSWTADGVFYNLKKLIPGNTITVTRGDDKTYKYKVVSSKIYPYDSVNMAQVLSPINPGKPGLNLMTCTGSVIKGTSEFNERLVVFTSLAT